MDLCFQKRLLVDMLAQRELFSDTLAGTITTTKHCLDLSIVIETAHINVLGDHKSRVIAVNCQHAQVDSLRGCCHCCVLFY